MISLRFSTFLDILRLEKNSDGPRKQTPLWKRTLGESMRLLKPPGDPLGIPRGPPGTPRSSRETPGASRAPLWNPYELILDHKNGHISTNRQRQKLSIAVFEAAHQGPSHERLDRAVFLIKRPPKSKKVLPGPGLSPQSGAPVPWPPCSLLYIDKYIYVHVQICVSTDIGRYQPTSADSGTTQQLPYFT